MQSTEIYRMLTRRPRRGRILFGTMTLVLIVAAASSLIVGRGSWALSAFAVALLTGLGFQLVSALAIAAHSVADDPRLVFWAHPSVIPDRNRWLLAFTRLHFLMLHLRDGRLFEVGLPEHEMNAFIFWLRRQSRDADEP